MTSFAFILGVVPLVLATGAGAEMRQALGTVVFYGMIGVTFFGIFLTPVFFVSIRWLTNLRSAQPGESETSATSVARSGAGMTPASTGANPGWHELHDPAESDGDQSR